MTDESVGPTEKFVRETGMKFPYAFDPKRELLRGLQVEGFPTAVLVDPTGLVVWKGHPANLREDLIRRHLEGALKKPVWAWGAMGPAVRDALRKGRFARALEAAAEDQALAAALRGLARRLARTVERAYEEGNFLFVADEGRRLRKELAGLPEADRVRTVLGRLDGAARKVIRAQKKLRKIAAGPFRRRKDVLEALKRLEKLATRNPGTYVEKEAARHRERLRALMERMRR